MSTTTQIPDGRAVCEEFIGTVNVHQLRHLRWPFLRLLSRRYVEMRELDLYERGLLATHRWQVVRVVPHRDATGAPSSYLFDIYGVPA